MKQTNRPKALTQGSKKDPIPLLNFLGVLQNLYFLHYFCAKFKSCFDYKFTEGQISVFIN